MDGLSISAKGFWAKYMFSQILHSWWTHRHQHQPPRMKIDLFKFFYLILSPRKESHIPPQWHFHQGSSSRDEVRTGWYDRFRPGKCLFEIWEYIKMDLRRWIYFSHYKYVWKILFLKLTLSKTVKASWMSIGTSSWSTLGILQLLLSMNSKPSPL